jgi:hypothetical protein
MPVSVPSHSQVAHPAGITLLGGCDDWAWLSLNRRSRQLFVTCGYERSGFS